MSLAETHEVLNQPPELENYNTFEQDQALKEAVEREGAKWALDDIARFGELTGQADYIELGNQANANKPTLHTHDRHGYRIDEVRFHPAYHRLMQTSVEQGLHASHWSDPKPGAHVARAAKYYLQNQVEAAHCCPITMTSAAIPALRNQPDIYAQWAPKILAGSYDARNLPHTEKQALTIGMAMTEKQGGSDVRANTTVATPLGAEGPGQKYELVGHKYFVSAPMCDAFLVLAQAPGGLSCFLLPRWREDGSKNPLQIQQLKQKMGNVANASCETELRGAEAVMIGPEGRGVPTILEMVAMTRFDCMIGSSAGMRQALAQASHHCAHRSAFGRLLTDQPLMQNVLADLAVESEAALMLTMRIARALDASEQSEQEKLLVRIGTAVGKYWICKRTPGHAYEAMECIGGMGVMEDTLMPRLFRESPVNAIWEGSGNVQCLDMLRAIHHSPGSLEAFMEELNAASGSDKNLDRCIAKLGDDLSQLSKSPQDAIQYRARHLVEKMALAFQGALLVQHGDSNVAEAFCASRLAEGYSGLTYGVLPTGLDCQGIVERARPKVG